MKGEIIVYRKLRGKIKEVYDTQEAFGKAMGMSKATLCQRLKGAVEWKMSEISTACELLGIPLAEAHLYFFNQKVEKTLL